MVDNTVAYIGSSHRRRSGRKQPATVTSALWHPACMLSIALNRLMEHVDIRLDFELHVLLAFLDDFNRNIGRSLNLERSL
jgi:hypothetical protein